MPTRSQRAPSGPTVTLVSFNINEVESALAAYAVAHGGALPNGPRRITKLRVVQTGDAAVLEINENS